MLKKIIAIGIIVVLAIAVLMSSRSGPIIRLVHASPDSYGDIIYIAVYQWNGSEYLLRENFTSSGGSCSVHDDQPTKFIVKITFNNTLASSTAEAISYTRVYMNITNGGSIWTQEELNNTACSEVGSFYELEEEGLWNQTGYPVAGVTYECSVLYQGYY